MTTDEYFIGLKKDSESGEWRWISDNSKVDATRGEFLWATNQPNGDGNCTAMFKNYQGNIGKYNDLLCTRRYRRPGYICESHAVSSGQEGVFYKSSYSFRLTESVCVFVFVFSGQGFPRFSTA